MAKKSSAHTLEYILLGLIRDEPSHGYALYESLKNNSELSLIWQVKRSKLYYLLDKSENQGYLKSTPGSGGPYPERKIYQITPLGREVFIEWLDTPVRSSRYVRLAFLSKLYFLAQIDRNGAKNLIDKQIEICQEWLANLNAESKGNQNEGYLRARIYQFRIGQIIAMIEWLENSRESLPG